MNAEKNHSISVLVIDYNNNDVDLVFSDGTFGYFYGDSGVLEFNEYQQKIDQRFDSYDDLIDHVSQATACISEYHKTKNVNMNLIQNEIKNILGRSTDFKVFQINGDISPQDPQIIEYINEFVFSRGIPSVAKEVILTKVDDNNNELEFAKSLIKAYLEFELNESLSEEKGWHEAVGVKYSEIMNAFKLLDTNYHFFD